MHLIKIIEDKFDQFMRWVIGFPRERHDPQKVEGMELFQEFFRRNTLLVPNNTVEYMAGIYPRKRLIVACVQNLTVWLHVIKLAVCYFVPANWIDVWLCNPFRMIKRADILELILAIFLLFFNIVCK